MTNLICLLLLFAVSSYAVSAEDAKGEQENKAEKSYVFRIPFASPAAALAALELRKDVQNQTAPPQGWYSGENWKIFREYTTEKPGYVEWAFTQPGNAAHPSVIKRYIDVGSTDHIYIDTASICSSGRPACVELNKIVGKANWRIKKRNEIYFIKEGKLIWKDIP